MRGFGADFLSPKYEDCLDPELLPDMKAAVERIRQAVGRGEKVLIYGDYDVDGVTASTVMHDALKLAGVREIEIMLPNRFLDGYGMSRRCVERAEEMGATLVVTVDCGSRNQEVIGELRERNIDTIVTDHHECGWKLSASENACKKPEAVAIVNPKRQDVKCPQELRELAGVGVAFKVAQALVKCGMIAEGQEKWLLDLVLIGTICDSMVLTGENRRLCYFGVKVLEKTRRVGLKELMKLAGVKKFSTEAIGFQIGPRMNAAGRMEDAQKALDLMLTTSWLEAARLAAELEELNKARKEQQNQALAEIRERGVGEERVLVECGEWHEGVLGIIAGRLVEEYRRPAFTLALSDGVLKGSGRSFGEFNLAEALAVCGREIVGGGGHAAACGVKVLPEKYEDFKRAVNAYYDSLRLENQERFLGVQEDLEIEEVEDLSLELMEELRKLEPFGEGNAEPVFLLKGMRVVEVARLGKEQEHLRLVVWDKQGKSMKLMQFFAEKENLKLEGGEIVNIWIRLEENEFRGIRSVEGRILRIG